MKDFPSDLDKHIFSMSNSTFRCKAKPSNLFEWTKRKAPIATGKPSGDISDDDVTYEVAQSINSYIFPGTELGITASQGNRISDEMFMEASVSSIKASPASKDPSKPLLLPTKKMRNMSEKIAFSAAKGAQKEGFVKKIRSDLLKQRIKQTMWDRQHSQIFSIEKGVGSK